jgi:tyrosyl-tRNA synthetase
MLSLSIGMDITEVVILANSCILECIMTLSEELLWRGFVHQSTITNLANLDTQKITFFHGFDASADSQAVGNLAALMLDRLFLRHGHNGILLAGGATSLIGDPGGKDKERPMQDEKIIAHNVSNAQKQINALLHGYNYKMVNNIDWFKDVKLIPFLRDVGKHYAMSTLVNRDYIAQRLGDGGGGISYTEFSYTLIQGYDYLYLYDKYGVTLQLGGSDQWGNCLSGVDLIRKARGAEAHVLTQPLIINKSTGKKFGKSEEGAIWLDEKKTSVYKFYQFWLNTDDEGVETYLKIFTELDKEAIDMVMAEFNANRSLRMAQRRLAYEVTKIVHGQKRADEVVKVTGVLFGEGDFLELAKNEINILKQELPVGKAGHDLPQVLVDAGLASSKKEARTFLTAGAISINGQKAGPENLDLFVKGHNLLRRGKNNFAIIEK